MHPSCYFRTDNINATGPFLPGPHALRAMDAVAGLDACRTHAQIDSIEEAVVRNSAAVRIRGGKGTLACRKLRLRQIVDQVLRRSQEGGFASARRDAFIGPLTIQMQNGHPF